MPNSRLSPRLTKAYQQRLEASRQGLERKALASWPSLAEFRATNWPEVAAAAVSRAQLEAVRATNGYLAAYLSAELGTRVQGPVIDSSVYVGKTADGQPLDEAFQSPLIGVRVALKEIYADHGHKAKVTPAEARRWLSGGTHGNLDQSNVDQLADKMRDGSWNPDLGVIRITAGGAVFDGQHRLEAVVQTGLDVQMVVAMGLPDPMAAGLDRAKRQVGMAFDFAHHSALLGAIHTDDRFDGSQRVTKGTCGACLALAGEIGHELWFPHHPGCTCVSQPVVTGVPDRYPVPTGHVLFAEKSEEEQNEALGPQAAALVRAGVIELSDLVEHEELDSDQPGFITQKPVDQLIAT